MKKVTSGAIDVLRDNRSLLLLSILSDTDQATRKIIQSKFHADDTSIDDILGKLENADLIEVKKEKYYVSQHGRAIRNILLFPLERLGGRVIPGDLDVEHQLPDEYELDQTPLGSGTSSVTFRGIQNSTGIPRTVKIFKPGIMSTSKLDEFKNKRNQINPHPAIPDAIGMGQIKCKMGGAETVLAVQVYEYVDSEAVTLHDFINGDQKPHLGRDFFKYFIMEIGGALREIERVGLTHGDLHQGNILVTKEDEKRNRVSFKLIDFSASSSISTTTQTPDLEMFKHHLIRCLLAIENNQPGLSLRELVGTPAERVISGLRNGTIDSFENLLTVYDQVEEPLPKDYFESPPKRPFEWLRVEMMPSLTELYSLFEPIESIVEQMIGTDNVVLTGPRGCGKSHYLRVLNFWPEVFTLAEKDSRIKQKLNALNYGLHSYFGILFECRVGEFKNFKPEATGKTSEFDPLVVEQLRHILILKIINKTNIAVREGIKKGVIESPEKIDALAEYLRERFHGITEFGNNDIFSQLSQYTSILISKEKTAEAMWKTPDKYDVFKLTEPDLDEYFAAIQRIIPALDKTQFFILVDDISFGRMHIELQKIFNGIVTSATKRYCFKVSCDKYMYTLETIDRRSIDPSHDITYIDISSFSLKSSREGKMISNYLQDVVQARLSLWLGNKSVSIVDILGKSQDATEFLLALSGRTKRDALYAGWKMIWQLSHGSMRTLFLLLNHIFSNSGFDKETPALIPPKEQDKLVREFSRKSVQKLLMLKGDIDGEPIGNEISRIASAFGQVSRNYLTNYDTGDPSRLYETISFERLDLENLSLEAQTRLQSLVQYDVFMTTGTNFSRAHVGLAARYDLNKLYAPAFRITYRIRNHMFLSSKRLELLLTNPNKFVSNLSKGESMLAVQRRQTDLFSG